MMTVAQLALHLATCDPDAPVRVYRGDGGDALAQQALEVDVVAFEGIWTSRAVLYLADH